MKLRCITPPVGETSVVFIHGVLSDGENCWRHENGTYWPGLLADESGLSQIGIYSFTYKTGFFSGTYRLGDVVDALKEHMRLDGVLDSRQLVFVCHSMGGIIARKFVVEQASELVERNTCIGLFLIASPSLGSDYANWLRPLARLFGHTQADALRFSQANSWLLDLDKEFFNLKEKGRLRIVGKELVEDTFVVLKKAIRRQVVKPFSGARNFGEHYKVPESDHSSIAKAENGDAIQHRLLVDFLKDFPKTVAEASQEPEPMEQEQIPPSEVEKPKNDEAVVNEQYAEAGDHGTAINAGPGSKVHINSGPRTPDSD